MNVHRDNLFIRKENGLGYILTIGGKRFYIAGDTENTPEMKALKNIDVAFLPMNLPYTMTPEMVADAAQCFQTKNPISIPLLEIPIQKKLSNF